MENIIVKIYSKHQWLKLEDFFTYEINNNNQLMGTYEFFTKCLFITFEKLKMKKNQNWNQNKFAVCYKNLKKIKTELKPN